MYSTIATVKPSAAPPMAQSTSLLLPNICLPLLAGRTWLWLAASSGVTEDKEVILPWRETRAVGSPYWGNVAHCNNNMDVLGRNLSGESERGEEDNICWQDPGWEQTEISACKPRPGELDWGLRGPNVTLGYTTPDTPGSRVSQIVKVCPHITCQASQHQTFRLEEY